MPLTGGGPARRCGLTVRTLHHYDAIGLLKPSLRSDAGYRLYDRANVERLHRIQALRQLGLSLADIGTVLSGPEQPRESYRPPDRPARPGVGAGHEPAQSPGCAWRTACRRTVSRPGRMAGHALELMTMYQKYQPGDAGVRAAGGAGSGVPA